MRFIWKIFIATFLIIIISFGTGGFLLINSVFQSTLNSSVNTAKSENKLICISFNAVVNSIEANFFDYTLKNFTNQISDNHRIIIDDKSQINFYEKNLFINELKIGEQGYQIIYVNGNQYIQVISLVESDEKRIYIESVKDISDIFVQREKQYKSYRTILICVAFISSIIIMIFARYITKPLMKLSDAAQEIANGNFDKRVKYSKFGMSREVELLTNNFNKMADNIENYIEEIKAEAQRKEDFVGNFTHELKTPLTSIIGYADMLRSYDLPADERRLSAEYIYKEGKRLEALSLHLLNLIVIRNNNFKFVSKNTVEFFKDIQKSLKFILEKYNIKLFVKAEKADIKIEPMLMKTVILNLVENACKASKSGDEVAIVGLLNKNKYIIAVADNGKGIPEKEISRITEAFYMVDKSRAREYGGAGLGLALCKEILSLHNTALNIESKLGIGTVMSFELEV